MKLNALKEAVVRGEPFYPNVGAPQDFKLRDILRKLRVIGNTDKALDMIYQWTKTGHINLKQFRELVDWWHKEQSWHEGPGAE